VFRFLRGAGCTAFPLHKQPSRFGCVARASFLCLGSAMPNPSLKLRPNGVPPGPRGRAVYHQPRGPGVTPSVPA
jgi:hypothetical protein